MILKDYSKRLAIIIPLIMLFVAAVISLFVLTNKNNQEKLTQMPAGQITPPESQPVQNSDWKIFTDDKLKLTFKYPEKLETKFIRTQEWPPQITVLEEDFNCKEQSISPAKPAIMKATVKGREYCVEMLSDGAAGTLYSTYTYSFTEDKKLIKLSFTLAFPECANYPEAENTNCLEERQNVDFNSLVDQIAQSLTFTPGENSTDINAQIIDDLVAEGVNCSSHDENGNVLKDQCKVDKVSGDFAKGTMPMAYWMAKKTDGKWKMVVSGNGIPQCSEVDKYSVPKEIYGNCIESSEELRF